MAVSVDEAVSAGPAPDHPPPPAACAAGVAAGRCWRSCC